MNRHHHVPSRPLRSHSVLLAACAAAMPWMACAADQSVETATGVAPTDYVWVEGEAATTKNVTNDKWYSGAVKKDMLSGGDWLTNYGDQDGDATFDVTIPTDGDYAFWVRANPIQSELSWKIGAGDWQEADTKHGSDQVNLANDDKPDIRILAWMKLGKQTLKAGPTTVAFRFHSKNHHHGAIDCFVLTKRPFSPAGITKPGEKLGSKEAGWWSFEPDADPLTADAALDLRDLNEKEAGANGPLTVKDGAIMRGDGKPMRVWACNANITQTDDADLDYLAARLAKNGFNMVRLHGPLFKRDGDDPTAINTETIAKYVHFIGACRAQGIYVHLSSFFPAWLSLKASDGIEGANLSKDNHPWCLLFFEPRLQELYKGWVKALLTAKEPSGMTIAEDPAVGVFEIVNEDSLFFWSFKMAGFGPGPAGRLEGMFADYLTKKYGGLDKAFAAWPGDHNDHDEVAKNRAGLYDAWFMTGDSLAKATPDKRKRMIDQIDFLAQTQRGFYADTVKFLREECHLKSLISASNWTTCDNATLGGIERWTYGPADLTDRHGYFAGEHKGDWRAGFSVNSGDTFADKCALLDPAATPLAYLQMAGHPSLHTEVAWSKPNRFVADADLLISSYESLQNVGGGFFLFALKSADWVNNGNSMWPLMMPGEFGQSPAAALQYRAGYLTSGDTVVRQVVGDDDLLALKSPGFSEGKSADFRFDVVPANAQPGASSGYDPLAGLVGRVERTNDPKATPVLTDLAPFIDRNAKTITSTTHELKWDYGNGVLTVNSPCSAAVSGFLSKAGAVALGAVTITSTNEYGTIQVISLDGLPLAKAKKILVQSFTEEKMSGWDAPNGRIKDVGRMPILVREISGTVTFADGGITATVLDANGYAQKPAQVSGNALTLPANALYVLVTR